MAAKPKLYGETTETNLANAGKMNATVLKFESALRHVMVRGFWGRLTVSISIEDGHISDDIEVLTKQTHRLSGHS